jgi:GNAT superfamily N-acetyltransferase
MKIIQYHENLLDECADFWWNIYKDMPYVISPDCYQTVNTPPIGVDSEYFVWILLTGLNGSKLKRWAGEVTDETIILAEDKGKVVGLLVCSVDRDTLTGNIMSAFMHRNYYGREVADMLLSEAIERFRKLGLHHLVASPNYRGGMEVECPIHLALLDAGFGFNQIYSNECYGVFLGGSLKDFRLQPQIQERVKKFHQEGIEIKRLTVNQMRDLRRADTGEKYTFPSAAGNRLGIVAFVDGLAIGQSMTEIWGSGKHDMYGRLLGEATIEITPRFRGKGIAKVLYHLGIEELVHQGVQGGHTATGINNPARFIYRSVGYRYWYKCFSDMSMQLR